MHAYPYFTTHLSPQAKVVFNHIRRTGSITQREAILDHSIQSLTRRISELNAYGIAVDRELKHHPLTDQRYARYRFAEPERAVNAA